MLRSFKFPGVVGGCLLWATVQLGAVVRADAGRDFFESKIRPVLVQHCYKCHSDEAGKAEGKFKLDCREALRQGGDSGPAVVPHKPDESLLLAAVAHDGAFVDMPPSGALPPQVVADLRRWIEMGAPDPRDRAASSNVSWEQVLAGRREWWSLQPVVRPGVPQVRDAAWSANPIDRFLQAGWEQAGLTPAADADRRTLFLRLNFLLTGLPPTVDEVEQFVRGDDGTYEAAVDRLLASPHFGERWARHWMDLARYKETHGSEHDPLIPHAWRYRDYLIRAFNADVPYDRFLAEQIAGDMLPPRRDPETGQNEALTATAFHRMVEFYPTPVDAKAEEITVVDSQIDALGKAVHGLTISCARCHDHKFDAVSQRDYYALYGILASTRTTMHRLLDDTLVHRHDVELTQRAADVRRAIAGLWKEAIRRWPERFEAAANRLRSDDDLPAKLDDKALDVDRDAFALRAAAAVKSSPLFPLARLALAKRDNSNSAKVGDPWAAAAAEHRAAQDLHSFRNAERYRLFADFSSGDVGRWYRAAGSFAAATPGAAIVRPTGDGLLTAIAPGGLYTHLLSDKQGGTLRSPNFTLDMQHISVLASGTNKARVRLVIENFQGDGVLFSSVMPRLYDPQTKWLTLNVRSAWAGRRAYLELCPRDDMTYVGQVADAASLPTDGRSGIGVRAVVFHDEPTPPELEPTLPDSFWQPPRDFTEVVRALTEETQAALHEWAEGKLNDRRAALLDMLLHGGFLPNTAPAEHPARRAVAEYRAIEEQVPIPPRTLGTAEEDGGDEKLFPRGDHLRAVEVVPRRYLEAIDGTPITGPGSGRLALVRAITSPTNPLTARVMVNRLWQHVFGEGLVRTVDNFGQLGEKPSHPELLDYLAAEFVADGWSMKRALRRMLLSRTFRLSTHATAAARERDPGNRLWSHAQVRRLEAEVIRDRLLWASGRGDSKMFGPSVPLPANAAVKDFEVPAAGPLDGAGRRSIYLEMRHNYPPLFLLAFDQPRSTEAVGRRDVTNVPAQSLALLNDPFVREQAERLAQRAAENAATPDARIRRLYGFALCREPTDTELQRARAFLTERDASADVDLQRPWCDLAHALLNTKEFIYLK
jgi:hypothetical protein